MNDDITTVCTHNWTPLFEGPRDDHGRLICLLIYTSTDLSSYHVCSLCGAYSQKYASDLAPEIISSRNMESTRVFSDLARWNRMLEIWRRWFQEHSQG